MATAQHLRQQVERVADPLRTIIDRIRFDCFRDLREIHTVPKQDAIVSAKPHLELLQIVRPGVLAMKSVLDHIERDSLPTDILSSVKQLERYYRELDKFIAVLLEFLKTLIDSNSHHPPQSVINFMQTLPRLHGDTVSIGEDDQDPRSGTIGGKRKQTADPPDEMSRGKFHRTDGRGHRPVAKAHAIPPPRVTGSTESEATEDLPKIGNCGTSGCWKYPWDAVQASGWGTQDQSDRWGWSDNWSEHTGGAAVKSQTKHGVRRHRPGPYPSPPPTEREKFHTRGENEFGYGL